MVRRMYCIVSYDIAHPKRLRNALKLSRRYLNWVQNSVFEGELSENQIAEFVRLFKKIMIRDKDSLLIYKLRNKAVVKVNGQAEETI